MTKEQIEADIATLRGLATKYIGDEQYGISLSIINLIEQLQWVIPYEPE